MLKFYLVYLGGPIVLVGVGSHKGNKAKNGEELDHDLNSFQILVPPSFSQGPFIPPPKSPNVVRSLAINSKGTYLWSRLYCRLLSTRSSIKSQNQTEAICEREIFSTTVTILESRLSHRYFHFHAYTPLIKAHFHLKYIFVFSRWQWSIHQCQHNFCVVLTKSLSQYFELYDMNYSSRAHII